MPTKAATLQVETPLLSCTKSLVLLFLRQWRHTATKDSTNCTSHTMKPRLRNAQEISLRSQLRNAHNDVDVGRVVANKSEYCNPNHFHIPYLRNPKSFSLFGFTFMQLLTWTLALITSSLCFYDLNWIIMGAKVEFVYNVVLGFVSNYIITRSNTNHYIH
jgi:hypothetical protein